MSESIFTGKARLFPLPNLVLFPHVMQPLHIFEPRYRQMTQDALDEDRLIAMALLRPGWESDYAGAPAIHSVACLGQIVAEQRLDDGRYNLLLRGTARLRIVKEATTSKLYRTARCELIDEMPIEDEARVEHWRRSLAAQTPIWLAGQQEVVTHFNKLLATELPIGALCDILAYALPLEADAKQALLEEPCVETRLHRLHDFMGGKHEIQQAIQRRFPPEFSVN